MEIIQKLLADDTTGRADGTVATRRFSLGDVQYAIDLSDENYYELKDRLDPFIEHARVVATRKIRSRSKAVRGQSADIRRWAKDHDLPVSDNGRLPGSVKEQYEAAHAA
jgi:hypothetical protein